MDGGGGDLGVGYLGCVPGIWAVEAPNLCHTGLQWLPGLALLIESLPAARPRAPHFTYSNSLKSPHNHVRSEEA